MAKHFGLSHFGLQSKIQNLKSKIGRPFRLVLLSFLLVLWLTLGTTQVYAHATPIRSDPVDGSTLNKDQSTNLKQVHLWFDQAIVADFSKLGLVDNDGKQFPLLNIHSERSADTGEVALVADLPELAPNAYRLNWQTRSEDDLHIIQGVVIFGIERTVTGQTGSALVSSVQPLEVVLRWLNFIALGGLVGAMWVGLSGISGQPKYRGSEELAEGLERPAEQLRRRLYWLALFASLLSLADGFGLLLYQGLGDGSLWQILTRTTYGIRWWISQALLLILIGIIGCQVSGIGYRVSGIGYWVSGIGYRVSGVRYWVSGVRYRVSGIIRPSSSDTRPPSSVTRHPSPVTRHPSPDTRPLPPVTRHPSPVTRYLFFVFPLFVVQAMNGHSAVGNGFWLLNVTMDFLHLLAASLWAGGLLVLAVAVGPMLRSGSNQKPLAWFILSRFGKLAAISLFVLVLTGLYKSGQQIASLDGLLTTLYGQALMVKLDLVLFAMLLGFFNTVILHPGVAQRLAKLLRRPSNWRLLPPRYLRRVVLVEAISLGLVLFLAAFLTSAQPARGPEFDPPLPANAAVPTISQPADDLIFSLSVKPNRPGQNFVTLGVFNTRRPAPAPIEEVKVRLQSPDGDQDLNPPVEAQGNGRYQIAGKYLNVSGVWKISVSVNRPALGRETSLTFPWQVLPPEGERRPVVFSNQPLGPVLNLVVILLVVVASLILFLYRRPFGWPLKVFGKPILAKSSLQDSNWDISVPNEGNTNEYNTIYKEDSLNYAGAAADNADHLLSDHEYR